MTFCSYRTASMKRTPLRQGRVNNASVSYRPVRLVFQAQRATVSPSATVDDPAAYVPRPYPAGVDWARSGGGVKPAQSGPTPLYQRGGGNASAAVSRQTSVAVGSRKRAFLKKFAPRGGENSTQPFLTILLDAVAVTNTSDGQIPSS